LETALKREDWFAVALILGAFATIGVLAWAFKKRGSPSRREFRLVKVGQGKPVLRNKQVIKVIRDQEGSIQEFEIHREIHLE